MRLPDHDPELLNLNLVTSQTTAKESEGPAAPMMLALLNASPDCIKLVELDGTVSYMNLNGQCAMDIDDFVTIRGQAWQSFWPDNAQHMIADALRAAGRGERSRFEALCPTAKGRDKWWDVSVAPVRTSSGRISRVLAVSREITEMVERERRLREHDMQLMDFSEAQAEALAAKEALLEVQDTLMREIDHRVKNSLAMISSLLRMQAGQATNSEVRDELHDASNRVLTVSRVHEKLYRGTDVSAVVLKDYIAPLCTEIRNAVADDSIELKLDLCDAMISADTAVALGLLVSELLSNALRHAFLEGGECAIEVTCTGTAEHFTFSVADNGCGLPDDFDLDQASGLGMKIVRLYAAQLGGGLTYGRNGDKGTRFSITVGD